MRMTVCTLLLSLALCGAAQAASGTTAGGLADDPIMARQDHIMGDIQAGARSHALSRRETDVLKNRFQSFLSVERRYAATGGLDDWERGDLQRRLDGLRRQLDEAREH